MEKGMTAEERKSEIDRLFEQHGDMLCGWEKTLLGGLARIGTWSDKQQVAFENVRCRCDAFAFAKAHGWVP